MVLIVSCKLEWCSNGWEMAICRTNNVTWKRKMMYLDTQCNYVSETGERLCGVHPIHWWINHLSERIDVVKLWGCPSDKGLLRPLSWSVVQHNQWLKSQQENGRSYGTNIEQQHILPGRKWYLSSGLRPVSSSSITTPKLYTSLCTLYVPDMANSGALYPNEPTTSVETW
jgi:hypothetical protein